MIYKQAHKIFKKASTTYFYSSGFFPHEIKEKIFTLYAYVRKADDFVDSLPADPIGFYNYKTHTLKLFQDHKVDANYEYHTIVNNFVLLARKNSIDIKLVEAFLGAMELDLTKLKYDTYNELQDYMYGSADVIGLMIAQLLNISDEAHKYAQKQGSAMQLINFIRDINEDLKLGRQYIPQEDLAKFNIKDLTTNIAKSRDFANLINFELNRYFELQKEAENGYEFIPKKYLIAVKTSADMYNYTAKIIKKDPSIIFRSKVKPTLLRVLFTGYKNTITIKS